MTLDELCLSFGKPLECYYPSSETGELLKRVGTAIGIRRGQFVPTNSRRGFVFKGNPYGQVYVLWHEDGTAVGYKSFKWGKIVGLKLRTDITVIPPTPVSVPQPDGRLVVRRMRPTLGG